MTRRFLVCLGGLLASAALAPDVAAQPLGTFRWQVAPFCNVVTVAITQNGAIYRLEGTDDQCGNGADAASVTGTAFPNADGTIGFGLNIVTTPGGRPLHVDAEITTTTFSGTWRDSAGATGTFAFRPGPGSGGSPRPLPSVSGVPPAIQLRSDGGFVAGGVQDVGAIPASGRGTRMMWYPGKAAFRAGAVDDTKWDDSNVGAFSVAMGTDTTASASGSFAMGQNAAASGSSSTAMGFGTTASGNSSTAMGSSTTASNSNSTAMGVTTTANGFASTAMGELTRASGRASTAMGNNTTASGDNSLAGGDASVAAGNSALAFGAGVRATGNGSVALGTNAFTAFNGSFVFADRSVFTEFAASGPNQFFVRAAGGVHFASNLAATLGVKLDPGDSQWTGLSDVNAKHQFRDLPAEDVLSRFARMPVTEWSYRHQDAVRHIGPTAQDFHAAFGLGQDPLRIGTLDASGVALAGVRALEARSRQDRTEHVDDIATLRAEIASLRALVATLMANPQR
jgi:hypothetical protein